VNRVADGRRGGYLALVDTGILPLWVAYSQDPILRVHLVHRLETLIARVRVTTDRQQVNVAMSHPRDLRQEAFDRIGATRRGSTDIILEYRRNRKAVNLASRKERGSVDRLHRICLCQTQSEKFSSFRAFADIAMGLLLQRARKITLEIRDYNNRLAKVCRFWRNLEAEISSSREPLHRYR